MKNVLLTGGLGYIGSHIALALIERGYNPVIVDNLYNSSQSTLNTLQKLTNTVIPFFKIDVSDCKSMEEILSDNNIHDVIHLAAFKSVPESIQMPQKYFENNVNGLKNLLKTVKKCKVKNFVFSSSAAIYDSTNNFPVDEQGILGYTNPYAFTKCCGEWMLSEFYRSNQQINIANLRYFNPIGNCEGGQLGDHYKKNSTNIVPTIYKCILNEKPFEIFGDKYMTPDGSAIRDYIHVQDLGDVHAIMLDYIDNNIGNHVFNVGLGQGISVKELITTFQSVNNIRFDVKISDPRIGDLPICFANADKLKRSLNWTPKYDLKKMCADAYKFFTINEQVRSFE